MARLLAATGVPVKGAGHGGFAPAGHRTYKESPEFQPGCP